MRSLMSPDRWSRVESLFAIAAGLAESERRAWLESEAAGDSELISEVLSLLQHTAAEQWAEAAIADVAGEFARSAPDPFTGRRFGVWRAVRLIGHGGMGAVYLAERDDGQFEQRAAIKVMRAGTDHEAGLTRFLQERRILAQLQHPDIARLLDGGATPEGLPYLVMEYIEGVPISEWCAQQNASLPTRLGLFASICDAVAFAHSNLIVHRDLKPSNILVTADGSPKLLDFGVAKLLDPELSPFETATGMQVLTPDYASPEQVRGEPVTTAADVYSLGAVLYELLSGARPHRITDYTPMGIAHAVCEVAPIPPSEAAADRGRAVELRGDLDTIVLKALQKDPARRYATVTQFSEDLSRWRRGLPIHARPDTLIYRSTKFARRNWLALTAALLVAASLTGGTVVALVQARRADARFQQVRRLASRLLFEFDEKIRELPGSTDAREMLTSTALEYLDSLSKEAGNDTGLRWEVAKAYERVGDVQGGPTTASLGHTAQAIESYRKALALQERLRQQGQLNPGQTESFGRAWLRLSTMYRGARQMDRAVEASSEGLKHLSGVSAAARADANFEIGVAQLYAGNLPAAIQRMQEAREHWREQLRVAPGPAAKDRLCRIEVSLCRAYTKSGRLEEALEGYLRVIALREAIRAEAPLNAGNLRELRMQYEWTADLLGAVDRPNLGRPAESRDYYRKSLELAEHLVEVDPRNQSGRISLAIANGKYALALAETQPARSLELNRRALDVAENLVRDNADRDLLRAAYYENVALPLRQLGRVVEAREGLERALSLLKALRRDKDLQVLRNFADTEREWGNLERAAGRRAEAVKHYRNARDHGQALLAQSPDDIELAYLQSRILDGLAATSPEDAATARAQTQALWNSWLRRRSDSKWVRQQASRHGL